MDYVELHCHSNFSFLDGATHPEDLIEKAQKLGYKALALTDHNGLYGIVRFSKAAKEKGIKPIIGAEITLENKHHLTLLAENSEGYSNLCQILSKALLSNPKNQAEVNFETLAPKSKGLICLSGCLLGEIPSLILKKDKKKAKKTAGDLRDVFEKGKCFLELQNHLRPEQTKVNAEFLSISRATGIPCVATNNVHYAGSEGRKLQDVLTCVKNHTNVDQAKKFLYPNSERHLKSSDEMTKLFSESPEALKNTLEISNRCNFILDHLRPSMPSFSLPEGGDPFSYLCALTYDGAKGRYLPLTSEAERQIAHELNVIQKLDLAGYFLIVWDIARFCRRKGILCQGRGSAANSAVCYCLGITAVDPVKLNLLFERFLSEERKEPPDIDIDIEHNRREEVIQYVYEKYGREHAGMVCEIITYRGRSAVRDVGKALGFSLEQVDRLAKLLDNYSDGKAIEGEIKDTGLSAQSKRVKLLIELCKKIDGFPRHLGIHVGGMVITEKPLSQIVPIENATMPERTVIQWDKDDASDAGLVKIDLLGLGMLTLVAYALRYIRKAKGLVIDPAKAGYDDPKVYDLLCRADTIGVFQVESRAQMNTLPRMKPRCFYDLVIEVALIRPGPIQGEMVHPYLRRRKGIEPVNYPHPCLEPILKRTVGVPLFQEQGMRVAMAASGFTPSQADELRRAMGHKRSKEKMSALSRALIQGMVKKGIDRKSAERIFKQLAAFADFGFAESHAASFALLVYVSAYLKLYHPTEFYCALLNAQPMGFYAPSTIIEDAKRHRIKILNIDAKKSEWDCTTEGKSVRLGLGYVKGLGESAKSKIKEERSKRPFSSLEDFARRTSLPNPALEQLAIAGAFDCFGLKRRDALWRVKVMNNRDLPELKITSSKDKAVFSRMIPSETLIADYSSIGFSTELHPMNFLREGLNKKGVKSAIDLKTTPAGRKVSVAGVVIMRQRPFTAKGFLFVTLEDETGLTNVVVKPQMLKKYRKELVRSSILLVEGKLEKVEGIINILGERFTPLKFPQEGVRFESRDFR